MKRNLAVLVLLVSTIQCYAQKSYQLYSVKLNAAEIIGVKHADFDPIGAADGLNNYLTPPLPVRELYTILGSIYDLGQSDGAYNLSPLLNTDEDDPTILNEINDRYIMHYGIKLLSDKHSGDATFLEFKTAYKNSSLTPSQRIAILNKDEYAIYKKEIEDSKYQTYITRNIPYTQEKEDGFKLGLIANLQAIINKVVHIDASTADSVANTVKRTVTATDLTFYEIRLNIDYIKSASAIITKYWQDKGSLGQLNNPDNADFSKDLYNFLNSKNQGIVAYVSLFSATFKTTKNTDFGLTLGATVSANVDVANKDSLTVAIKAAVEHTVKDSATNAGGNTYYVINYGVDNLLEIGACNEK